MDGSNLLTGGVETLNEIKENLLDLHVYQSKHDTLISEEEKVEKSIKSFERVIADEIIATTKERRQEIEDAFDKQIDKTESRVKKTKGKRDKRKSHKMSERIDAETASLREENGKLRLEANTLFRQKHIPSFCNTGLYYALYSPKYFGDYITILCALLITLLIIPCGIYFFILPEERVQFIILIYILTVVLFGGLYFLIANLTKEKKPEVIKQVKELRSKIRANKKEIVWVKKTIRKDKDESTYGLENFDGELSKLEKDVVDITDQKKEALSVFDNTTYQIIATEINGVNEDKLSNLKSKYKKTCSEARKLEEDIKVLTIKIASEYEPFIGKDLMTRDRLDALINIIQAGSANTISEAIAFHKKSMDAAMQKL